MSTVFYVRAPKTELDAIMRVEPRSQLVGKSSKGGTFTFYGDRANGIVDYESWLSWLVDMHDAGGQLVDECGSAMNIPDLLKLVDSKRNEPNKNATQFPSTNNTLGQKSWLDPDGNDFCSGDWS